MHAYAHEYIRAWVVWFTKAVTTRETDLSISRESHAALLHRQPGRHGDTRRQDAGRLDRRRRRFRRRARAAPRGDPAAAVADRAARDPAGRPAALDADVKTVSSHQGVSSLTTNSTGTGRMYQPTCACATTHHGMRFLCESRADACARARGAHRYWSLLAGRWLDSWLDSWLDGNKWPHT